MASHVVRSMIDYAKISSLSIIILFIDLVKAFDRIIREVVIGWTQGHQEDLCGILQDLGFPPLHADELTKEIQRGTIIDEILVHPHVKALLASLHTKSWFKFGQSEKFIVVNVGGRQGCRFGGTLFNMAYTRALDKFCKDATKEGIPLTVRLKPNNTFPTTGVIYEILDENGVVIFDVTFVDDEAVILTASVPKAAIKKTRKNH